MSTLTVITGTDMQQLGETLADDLKLILFAEAGCSQARVG